MMEIDCFSTSHLITTFINSDHMVTTTTVNMTEGYKFDISCISGFLLIYIWIYGNNIIVLTIEVYEKTIGPWLWGLYWIRGIIWGNIYLGRQLSPCLIIPGALPWLKHNFLIQTFLISCFNRKKYKLYIFLL